METDTYVSLDLETTGLNPLTETILEIGAVRFKGKEAPETWHSLVDPRRPIPRYIEALTGITPEMVAGAPSFSSVSGELRAFIGDAPVIGHRVSFDVDFLASHSLGLLNAKIDTWELSSILYPDLPNHQLGTLAAALSAANPTPHRALADALAARDVFLALLERVAELEYTLLQELTRLMQFSDSGWGPLLKRFAAKAIPSAIRPFQRAAPKDPPLQRAANPAAVDQEAVEAVLAEDGPFQQVFTNFEDRPQQRAMAKAVARALNEGGQVLLEAGTGVGKSLAYLLPAVLFAVRNSTPVVVSTATINLQEQLLTKDVPTLRKALDAAGPEAQDAAQFRTALLKGRGNYLCRRRWQILQQDNPSSPVEARFRARILVWLALGASGDVGDLNLPGEELLLWGRISAVAEYCSPASCPHMRGNQCFLFTARDRARSAHIVLVNHALLLSDLATDSIVLPDYEHIVIDEAHHLEEEATSQWGLQLGHEDLSRYLGNLLEDLPGGKRTGLLPQFGGYLRGKPAATRSEGQQIIDRLEAAVQDSRRLAGEFFRLLSPLVERESTGANEDGRRLRLTRQVLGSTSWAALLRIQEAMSRPWNDIQEGLGKLYALLEQGDELADEISARRQEGQTLWQNLAALTGQHQEDVVRWAALEGQGKDRLCSAPLHVGQLLEERLLANKETVILTSATLTTEGTFEHLKERLGLSPSSEILLGSPFDYKRSTLLWVAKDLPEPGQRQYQGCLEQALIELLAATEGRALVLFTSHNALRTTLHNIRTPLERQGLLVVGHGVDGSRNQILQTFKRHKGTILLGTSSFWEGVDVVGDALSLVVITRLPFHVPSDPVFAARSQSFQDGFNQYALPLSILRFRQGFGRLIRSRSDRGVMAILDSRVYRKAYGRAFLQSLPRCTAKAGPARELPGEAKRWLESFEVGVGE